MAATTLKIGTLPSFEVPSADTTPLPPKSPSSIMLTGKFIFAGTANHQKFCRNRKRNQRGKSKERRKHESDDDTLLSGESLVDQSLEDPTPHHLNIVSDDSSDLSTTDDLSMVSFQNKNNAPDPLRFMDVPAKRGFALHRRARSWDPSVSSNKSSCFEVSNLFRRQKVMAMETKDEGRISGHQLHETAKDLLNSGSYTVALEMFQQLLQTQQERFGDNHSSVAAAIHNVGVVKLRMGKHVDAEQVLIQAVAIRRKVLGNDHLDLAASLGKLGSAQVVLGKFDEALQNLRQASKIVEKTLGRNHKTMGQILYTMACLYFEAGEFFSAQATFEDACDIFRQVFPTETDRNTCMVQMTEALCNIGSIQNKRKQFPAAIASFSEALDLQRGVLGHTDRSVIASLDNLAYSFAKNKSYNRALSCYKEMLNAQLSHHGAFTVECSETLKKKILMFEKLKDLTGALKATKKALEKATALPSTEPVLVHELYQLHSELKHTREKQKRKQRFY